MRRGIGKPLDVRNTAVPANRYLLFLSIALLGLVADLASKSWVFSWLGMPGGRVHWVIPGYFGLETSLNEGALFGIGVEPPLLV